MANLHVKLPDDLYTSLQSNADRNFRSVSAQIVLLIETWLKEEERAIENEALLQRIRQQPPGRKKVGRGVSNLPSKRTSSRSSKGLRGLEPVIGAISLALPTGTENEGIDADLVRAYSEQD